MKTCVQVHAEWLLTPERVGIHLPTVTAVAADLHLGYDQARIRAGDAVPVAPLAEHLAPLRRVLIQHGVRRLVVAGDLVEDARCVDVLPRFLEWLAENRVEFIGLIPGNHDKGLAVDGLRIWAQGLSLDTWRVVHGDKRVPAGRVVQGHIHPMLRWSRRAAGACFLVGPDRLILPAYSLEAAGVDVVNAPRWRDYRCCVIAGDRVLDLGELRGLGVDRKPQASGKRGVRANPRLTAIRRNAYQ
jgi:metallophosphoesterase superfamily enzyme